MKRIGILGANGQVGSEVCLFLRLMKDVEVVPICRSEIASAFLTKCGLDCRHGRVERPEEAARLLAGCDVVADFSLPTGSPSEVRAAMRGIIINAVHYAPPQAAFVYLSSITAFGIPDFRSPLKHYSLSRNTYGACKRYGERLAQKAGSQTGRSTYVLRVGVVHGELQAVSRKMVADAKNAGNTTAFVPDCPSYTVFAFSIAEALVAIANGREEPGLYTMLSNPAWSWKDVHEWYARKAGVPARTVLLPPDESNPSVLQRAGASFKALLKPAVRVAISNKDLIAGYLSVAMPRLENRLRAVYSSRNAAAEIAAGLSANQYRPYGNNHSVFPGRRLQTLSDSRISMQPYIEQLQERMQIVLGGAQPVREVAAGSTPELLPPQTASAAHSL